MYVQYVLHVCMYVLYVQYALYARPERTYDCKQNKITYIPEQAVVRSLHWHLVDVMIGEL